jgi:superfamily II DNA or RNA helicase
VRAEIEAKLREWQIEPARKLLDCVQRGEVGFDTSDTGTGKTFVASAIAAQLAEPCLVVCPKIAVSQWHRAMRHFDDVVSVIGWEHLRTGRTPFGRWENGLPGPVAERTTFVCVNCQQVVESQACYAHPRGIHCVRPRVARHRYGNFAFAPEVKLVIFDEFHRANGRDSLNSELPIAAHRQRKKILCLSATPATSPLHFRALGYLLGLHNLDDFYDWARHYGCRPHPQFRGFHWMVGAAEQTRIMRVLNAEMASRSVHITTAEIPGFPARTIEPQLFDLPEEETAEMISLQTELKESLEALERRQSLDKNPEHPLTVILRARQKIELLKVPIVAELGQDSLDKGMSVVWFVNFRQTIDELRKRFPNAGVIDGSVTGDARDEVVEAFQSNALRELIVNCEAGGIALSLQDLHGGHPRDGIAMPVFSAVTFIQFTGRLPRDGGKSPVRYRIVLAAGTLDERIYRKLGAKMNNLQALVDEDFTST